MSVIINPGSGPVANATKEHADIAITKFVEDLGLPVVGINFLRAEDDGRFTYHLTHNGRVAEVEMPGLPLDRVRFMQAADQNIWDFPRLYVDGSSWVWCFALGVTLQDDEEEA